ncbi:MAG: CDP-alcohol phosphatidyltransferase family protein [Candidatus Paceibacterota bacterium]|jgi:phosphatidylglycerophosphate synthase
MNNQTFAGDKKSGTWLTQSFEDKYLRSFLLRFVPSFVQTYHLTLMTIMWSVIAVWASYMARVDIQWLWVVSLMLACQYVTDLLDGAVGRARNTGLIKWGYYMDHFLDYIFFSALILGYAFIFPADMMYIFILLALIQIGFLINLFLSFAATNAFKISFARFGPTETRIAYILFNTYLIYWGTQLPMRLLPYFVVVCAGVLTIMVYRTQKQLWKIDMESKAQNTLHTQ